MKIDRNCWQCNSPCGDNSFCSSDCEAKYYETSNCLHCNVAVAAKDKEGFCSEDCRRKFYGRCLQCSTQCESDFCSDHCEYLYRNTEQNDEPEEE